MNRAVWQILDEMRSGKSEWNADQLTERLSKAEPKPSAADLWLLCSQLQEKKTSETPNDSSDPRGIHKQLFGQSSIFENFLDGHGLQQPRPDIVIDFALDYLASVNPKRLLNFWTEEPVGVSALLNRLPSLSEALAFTRNSQAVWQAELFNQMANRVLGWSKAAEWRIGKLKESKFGLFSTFGADLARTLEEISGKWDAIICFPPMGDGPADRLLVLEIASKLSPGGVGLFIVPPSFFGTTRSVSVYDVLGRDGLAVEAVFSIPLEHRGNSAGVDLSLITIRRGAQPPLFVGELQVDAERRTILLKNLQRRQESKDAALGMLVEKEGFRSYGAVKAAREYQTQLTRQGLPLVNLSDVLKEANGPKHGSEQSFSEEANALYLPSLGFSEAVTSTEQFRIKPHNYLQLVLKPDLVNADFLAKFLNSALGLQARRSLLSGNFISKISVGAVRKGVTIPLPPLSVQSAVIESDTRLRDLATAVENLRKQLWGRPAQEGKTRRAIERINREETFEEWLKTLPFPLASILWNYHSAAHDPKEQFELLLKFFEGLAEFMAAILLSAARRDELVWNEVRKFLSEKRNELHFETSTFGTWIEISAFITRRFIELWNSSKKREKEDDPSGPGRCEAAFGTSRAEVIEAMLSKELMGVLRRANQFRNDYGGHYGVLGEETATNLLVQLRSFLSEVRSSFGQAWESYQLLMPTKLSEWTGQYHEVFVNLLQGLNTPFRKETRQLSEPLKRDTLYLLDKDRDSAVELLPLVKISSAPKDVANACYFYNRKQPSGIRYVSYHFEKEADRTFSGAEVEQMFRELFGDQVGA
jgi:hypothetical protein